MGLLSLAIVVGSIAVMLWVQGGGLAIPGGAGSSPGVSSGTPLPPLPPPVTLVANGTQWDIGPSGHVSVPIALSYEFSLCGTFYATAPLVLYLMTGGQFGGWLNGTSGAPPASDWSAGPERSGWVNAFDGGGSYQLLFVNPNGSAGSSLRITAAITASFDSS
ncbi:MAG TPA: hypothetical protein VGV64_02045 [Thermoplasmata archaeon]|nr:hypothetical protein [Thermoplasmata archaeon]